jgi:hypothetical protein
MGQSNPALKPECVNDNVETLHASCARSFNMLANFSPIGQCISPLTYYTVTATLRTPSASSPFGGVMSFAPRTDGPGTHEKRDDAKAIIFKRSKQKIHVNV